MAVANAYTTGQKVMGHANQRLGKLLPGLPEDLRFCGFFGVLVEVSVTAWDMMENHSVLPPTPKFLHFYGRLLLLELSKTGTYEKYPYQEFHEYRARVSLLAL